MRWFKQLDFLFPSPSKVLRPHRPLSATLPRPVRGRTRDSALEEKAAALLLAAHCPSLSPSLRVEWNSRLRTAAGRADCRANLITLNPLLRGVGSEEIERTLRHELAHLLAHARAGRRRIAPHGAEWRMACRDLGIADEKRCHTLPFPARRQVRRLLYRCSACAREFPRVRPIRGRVACLACCRQHHHGQYHARFRLQLVRTKDPL